MKNLKYLLVISFIFLLSSCNDNSSKPDDSQLFADKLELSTLVLLDSSNNIWGYLIKDTFNLYEPVRPRVTVSKVLDSTDIVTVSMLNNKLDTIYVSRMTYRKTDSDHVFIFNSLRPNQFGPYYVSAFYYHKNIRTNLNQKILVYE